VLHLLNTKGLRQAGWELNRITLVTNALRLIEQDAPKLLPVFGRKLLSRDVHTFFGTHHEVVIAGKLLAKGLRPRYEPPGGPDFILDDAEKTVGIECSSAHIGDSLATAEIYVVDAQEPGEKDLAYKLASAIRAKAKKPYAAPNVLVSLDTTNIEAVSGAEQTSLDEAVRALEKTSFGAALLWVSLFNVDDPEGVLYSAYRRIDAPKIAPELRTFLDLYWPKGEIVFERTALAIMP
jgi:hypothetical protein